MLVEKRVGPTHQLIVIQTHEVRARVRVLRLPYPIVERGRLILDVQEFETV